MPLPAELPILVGERLRLRPLGPVDVPALHTLFADPRVTRYWSHGPLATLDDAAWYLRDVEAGRRHGTRWQWGVARRDDDAVIGTCTLFAPGEADRCAEIGYALGSAHWGHGYAREAVRLLIGHAFGPLGLHQIDADVDPRNAASCRLLEALGFRNEGLVRERWYAGGECARTALYRLSAA